jgi:hypothetical protein
MLLYWIKYIGKLAAMLCRRACIAIKYRLRYCYGGLPNAELILKYVKYQGVTL